MKPISVGIAGLGRSGWGIHARHLGQLPKQYRVAAVMDFDAARRAEAVEKFDCAAHDNYAALLSDPDIELIVVATPNRFHCENVLEALRAGKHVVCEKPFGASSADAQAMIEAAQKAGRIVAPFQNRRYESLFQKVMEIAKSGQLGEIQMIRTCWDGFTRRWDWQTLSEFGGGQLYNNGPHALDQALQIFGEHDYELMADLRNVLTSGDAEDHIEIMLKPKPDADGKLGPVLQIEMSSCSAFPQDRWTVLGNRGSLRSDASKQVEWKWLNWDELPARPVDKEPTPDRSYNSEPLPWHAEEWLAPACETPKEQQFYGDLFASIREDEPLTVTPQSVARVMRLIEEVHASTEIVQGIFSSQKENQ